MSVESEYTYDSGRVQPLPKGVYDSSKEYEMLDIVTFDGKAYLCRKPTLGVSPIDGKTTENWQPFGSSNNLSTEEDYGINKPDGSSILVNDGTYYVKTSFTTPASRSNITSGESISSIWGKICKFFSDLKTVAFSGSYNDLINKPSLSTVATSGSYNDLSNKPALKTVATSGNYNDLSNKPNLATVATSGNYNDLSNKPNIPVVPTLATVATSGRYSDLSGTPSSLPASDVYSWAKKSTKPSYSYSEIGGTCGYATKSGDSIKNKTNRVFLIIGDSYAAGVIGENRVYHKTWVCYFQEAMQVPRSCVWCCALPGGGMYNQSNAGYDVYNQNTGEMDFAYRKHGTNLNFASMLLDYKSSITNLSSVTDIIVTSCLNDHGHTFTEIGEGFGQFNSAINSIWGNDAKNINVWFGAFGSDRMGSMAYLTEHVVDPYSKWSAFYGWNYIHNSEFIMRNYSFFFDTTKLESTNDTIHPSENGHKHIGWYMSQGIMTGSCNITGVKVACGIALDSDICSGIDGYIKESQHNGAASFELGSDNGTGHLVFHLKNIRMDSKGDYVRIGRLNSDYISGHYDVSTSAPSPLIITKGELYTGGAFVPVDVYICLNGHDLYVAVYRYENQQWPVYTGCGDLYVRAASVSLDMVLC